MNNRLVLPVTYWSRIQPLSIDDVVNTAVSGSPRLKRITETAIWPIYDVLLKEAPPVYRTSPVIPLDTIYYNDCLVTLKNLPSQCIDTVVTSPPYFNMRDYGHRLQIGREQSIDEYLDRLIAVFDQCNRLLKDQGSLWVNIGDKYQDKSMLGVPYLFLVRMINNGWLLVNDVIWHKLNCTPSGGGNRHFIHDYEHLFWFSKSTNYYYKPQKEQCTYQNPDGSLLRYKRSVWSLSPCTSITTEHTATFPEVLIESPIDATCPVGGVVLDPFCGTATTCIVAKRQQKHYIGVDLNQRYIEIARRRLGITY